MSVETEQMMALPKGWKWISIGETGDYINGFAFKPGHRESSGLPIVRIQNLTDESKHLNTTNIEVPNVYKIDTGDMLMSWSATLDVFIWRRGPALVNQHIFKVVPEDRVMQKGLLFYWLKLAIQQLQKTDHLHGSTMMHINRGPFMAHLVPLPPVAEQTRIVAKLEELLSDLDAGVAELKAAQKKLAQYRQSLLKAAVEGALTAEWREARRKHHSTPLSPRGRGVGGEGIQALNTSDAIWFRDRARQLRQEQTPMEQWLWQQLRAKRFSGFKFRRQQKIGRYIVDFVCFAQKLIIELDGSQHADAQVEDAARDHWLRGEGFRVLRFWNNELLSQTDAVLEAIWQVLQQEPQEPPLPSPSPTRGEGLETGAQLLERILIERRARWEAKQLAKFAEQGKTPPKDWQKKYPEPVQPDITGLPELPEGWVWASVEQLGRVQLGRQRSPNKVGKANPTPYIRAANITENGIDLSDVLEMEFSETEKETFALKVGDVLLTEASGSPEHVGRPAIWIKADGLYCFQNTVLRFSPEGIASEFAFYSFLAMQKLGVFSKLSGGVGINHLSAGKFSKLPVALAPTAEQLVLVENIKEKLLLCDEQVISILHSLKQSTAQRQNILRAAFAGQLVPQDPDDEPASVLLERIRAERAAVKMPRGRKTKETSHAR